MSGGRPEISLLYQGLEEELGLRCDEDESDLRDLAAVGFTYLAWRSSNALENWHEEWDPHIGEPLMMRANISTFRAARPFFEQRSPDWDGLQSILCDPEREIVEGVALGELLGDVFEEVTWDMSFAAESCRWAEEKEGLGYSAVFLAFRGGSSCRNWFGTPWWPNVVECLLCSESESFGIAHEEMRKQWL